MTLLSRRKGTIGLIATSYVLLVLLFVKSIFLIPFYLKHIDVRLYGAWLATGSIIAYLGLLDFGLNGVLLQRVAASYGKKNFEKLGSIIGVGLMIGLTLSFVPAVLGFLLAPWVSGMVHMVGPEADQLKMAFVGAGIGTSMMLAMYCIGGVLIALQRQVFHGVMLVTGDILGIAMIIICLRQGWGLFSIPVGTIVGALTAVLGEGFYLWRFLKKKKFLVSFNIKKDILNDLAFNSMWQFASRSASTAARQSDNLIVGALIDPRYCVVLTVTKKASEMLSMLVGHVAGAFLPGLAHLNGEDDKKKFKHITFTLFRVTSLVGICLMIGYFLFNRSFVNLWVGAEYFGGQLLTMLFCIYGVLFILSTIFYNIIFAKGEMITVARANILEVLIRIPLCIIMVKLWGIKGAAAAAVFAIIPTNFLIQAKKFTEGLEISRKEILDVVKIIFLQIFISITVGVVIMRAFEPQGLFCLSILGVAYLTIASGMCLFVDQALYSKVISVVISLMRRFSLYREGSRVRK